jgi:hypothetical protein
VPVKVFRFKRGEVTEEMRRLHKVELYEVYPPNIFRTIKSRIRLAGHVAYVGRGDVHTGFWWGNLRKGDYFENLGVDGRIILKWNFVRWYGGICSISLADVRDSWPAVVIAVVNVRVL